MYSRSRVLGLSSPQSSRIVVDYQGFTMTNNRLEGEGVVVFCNGSTFEGQMVTGIFHGLGKYSWRDGVTYKGDFVKGRIIGNGRYEWPDGSWYSGEVRFSKKHGYGSYCDGTQFVFYVGNWNEDKKHGQGRLDYNAEGTWYYNGEWFQDKRHGNGVQHFQSGNIYNGEWRNGFADGWGAMYFHKAEQVFEGMWKKGQRHGHGEQYWLMKPSASVCIFQHHMYKGQWVNDKRNGFGIFIYADGSKYEGYWKDDRKSGRGIFFHKNGARYLCDFDEDKIIAKVETNGRKAVGPYQDLPDGMLLFCPDVDVALPKLDGYDWKPEKQKIRNLILSKITCLRSIYYEYSALGKTEDSISAGVLDCMRFLQMCRDLQLHHLGWCLGRVMSVLRTGSNRIPWMKKKLIPWKFVRKLIILSYRMFNENSRTEISAVNCLNLLLTNHIERWNKQFNGVLFADPERTPFIIDYVDLFCEIYRRVCASYQQGNPNTNINVRHFLWFIKDLRLLGVYNLTANDLVKLLTSLIPCFKNEDLYDFNIEMTFLDFIDAILLIGEAFYSDLTVSQSKEMCGKFVLPDDNWELFESKNAKKMFVGLSVGNILSRILLFRDMIPKTLTETTVYSDEQIFTRAKDKDRKFVGDFESNGEFFPTKQTRSQSFSSSLESTTHANVLKNFSFDKLGDITGTKERDFWVIKIRRFLDNLFIPAAHIWMMVHAKVDWVRKTEAELASIESFSNIILPHAEPSTIWFDES